MSRRKRRHKSSTTVAANAATLAVASPPTERLRPWLLAAIVALLVARVLYPSEPPAETGDGLPVVMLWIALAVVWMLGAIGRKSFSFRFGWVDAAVLGLVAWHTLAAVVATTSGSPRPAVNMLWEWIGLGLAFFLARQFIATRREARAVVVVMIALAVGLSGYGLYQVAWEMPETRAIYERDPERALAEAGLVLPEGTPQRLAFEKRLESREPLGTFALTNSLAGYLAPWLLAAAAVAVFAGPLAGPQNSGKQTSPTAESRDTRAAASAAEGPHPGALPKGEGVVVRTRIGIVCCAVPVAVCLILTKSRSGYLAVLVGLLLLGAWWGRSRFGAGRPIRGGWKRPLAVVAALAIVLGGVIAGGWATGQLDVQVLSEAPKSLDYRLQWWQSTMRMIADAPLFGCGPGNFQQEYTRYKLPEASEEVADPHNLLFEVWATAGTPAMLALLAVLGTLAWTLWPARSAGGAAAPLPDESRDAELCRTGATVFVLAGGAAGFLLALPLGMLSTAPPGLAATGIALPLAAGCAALLWPWVDRGRMPVVVPVVGLVVLLLNLLAAGGIGSPSVAGTLWLLAALTLNLTVTDQRRLPWSMAAAGLVLAMLLALTCYRTAYGPVLQSRAALSGAVRARFRGDRIQARRMLEQAAAYDPLSFEPWQELAGLAFEQWLTRPLPESRVLKQFEGYAENTLQVAPNSSSHWGGVGRWYLQIGQRLLQDTPGSDRTAWALQQAQRCLRKAVELYPTSALLRAELAQALLAAGDCDGFQREAEQALRLSDNTPHADKKLPDELRQNLLRRLSRP